MGKIFIICGPSGVGKGTIINGLIKNNKEQIRLLPTLTTRMPKPRDKATGHYIYTTKDFFMSKIKNKEIFEYNIYNNNYYGTLKKDIEEIINNNQIAIMEQDIKHALITKKYYLKNIFIIFIYSPIEIIKKRIIKRDEDTSQEIENRLILAEKELKEKNKCNYIIENIQNHPEIAIKKCLNIILKK